MSGIFCSFDFTNYQKEYINNAILQESYCSSGIYNLYLLFDSNMCLFSENTVITKNNINEYIDYIPKNSMMYFNDDLKNTYKYIEKAYNKFIMASIEGPAFDNEFLNLLLKTLDFNKDMYSSIFDVVKNFDNCSSFVLYDKRDDDVYIFNPDGKLKVVQLRNMLYVSTKEISFREGDKPVVVNMINSDERDRIFRYSLKDSAFYRSDKSLSKKVLKSEYIKEKEDDHYLVCCSGGMDSTLSAYIAKKIFKANKITILNFDYGQRCNREEFNASIYVANQLGAKYVRLVMSELFSGFTKTPITDPDLKITSGETGSVVPSEWVPSRNLVMLSLASALAETVGAGTIVFGGNMEEGRSYPDNTSEFTRKMSDAIEEGSLTGVKLRPVLHNMSKMDIVLFGDMLGVPFDKTISCYNPITVDDEVHPCGMCGSCILRRKAFIESGLRDPQEHLYLNNEVIKKINITEDIPILKFTYKELYDYYVEKVMSCCV